MDLHQHAVNEIVFASAQSAPPCTSGGTESAFTRPDIAGSGGNSLDHHAGFMQHSTRQGSKMDESVVVPMFDRATSVGGNIVAMQYHDGPSEQCQVIGASVPSPICIPFPLPHSNGSMPSTPSSPFSQSPTGQFAQPAFAPPDSVSSAVTSASASTDSNVQMASDRLAFLQSPAENVAPPGGAVNGQFYVMLPSQDTPSSQQPIAPRPGGAIVPAATPAFDSTSFLRPPRDDRRRATHNEVERRRRDKINSWITKLQQLIPGEQTRSAGGMTYKGVPTSKGAVLARAVDYIEDLQRVQAQLIKQLKRLEEETKQMDQLRKDNEQLAHFNSAMRDELLSLGVNSVNGMSLPAMSVPVSSSSVMLSDSSLLPSLSSPLSAIRIISNGNQTMQPEQSSSRSYATPFVPVQPVTLTSRDLRR